RPSVVLLLDGEVILEELDDWQVAHRATVRDGASLEDSATLPAMLLGELVDEPGLSHAGLADHREELSPARRRHRQPVSQDGELAVAPDERRHRAPEIEPPAFLASQAICWFLSGRSLLDRRELEPALEK